MHNIDIKILLLGVLTSLMMIYLLIGLFPGVERRQLAFERRIKRGEGTIIPMSRVKRIFATLMIGIVAAQLLASAFHYSLGPLAAAMEYYACMIGLCVFASWSIYQVTYALIRGKVRKFSNNSILGSTETGYCTRVAEPVLFWYHILIYGIQGIVGLVLPIYVVYQKML